MKSFILLGLIGLSLSANANVFCQSKEQGTQSTVELVRVDNSDKYQLKTSKTEVKKSLLGSTSNSSSQLSQPMSCEISENGAICSLSILKVKFVKNLDNDLFSITQGFEIPNKPELKDPSTLSFGNNFECSFSQ